MNPGKWPRLREWKERPDLLLAVVAIGVTLFFGILSIFVQEVRDVIRAAGQRPAQLLLIVGLLVGAAWVLRLRRRIERIERRLGTPTYDRFESIQNVRYGHVEYFPFLYYRQSDGAPVGVGVRVLEALLSRNGITRNARRSSWKDMLDGLVSGTYDLIATPLFETNERSKLVAFSTPMFFADVGIYVRYDFLHDNGLRSWSDAIRAFTSHRQDLRLEVIRGELSEKMAAKHLGIPQKQWTMLSTEEATVQDLIEGLVDYKRPGDVVFAERFVAELKQEVKNGEVVNILREGELLYPVGFAMRREDYVLRNFINIKLMELDDAHPDRILGFIVEELKQHEGFETIDLGRARAYFVRKKAW